MLARSVDQWRRFSEAWNGFSTRKKAIIIGFQVVLILVMTGVCSPRSDEEIARSYGETACIHFRNVMADTSAGLLTDAELRDKIKEIRQSAQGAVPAIEGAAADMLRMLTFGQSGQFLAEVQNMSAACRAIGY